MLYRIYDRDTGNCHDTIVTVEDFEVAELWGKRKPIVAEEGTEIDIKEHWDVKQLACADLRKNKVKILENVFLTNYEKYSILYYCRNGKVYHFNNREFELKITEPDELVLIKRSTQESACVYKNGVFCQTKGNWLMESSQQLSKKKCSGIKMYSDLYGKIDIKDHQITAAMFIGQDAIELTMGETAEFEINHRNLENEDNRIENLEIVTISQNNEHYRVLNKFIENKLTVALKKLGVSNYTIQKLNKKDM